MTKQTTQKKLNLQTTPKKDLQTTIKKVELNIPKNIPIEKK